FNCFQHSRMAMAQNHRTPRAHVINITIAVDIPEIGTISAVDEYRLAVHCFAGARGGIDTSGENLLRSLKRLLRTRDRCNYLSHGSNLYVTLAAWIATKHAPGPAQSS